MVRVFEIILFLLGLNQTCFCHPGCEQVVLKVKVASDLKGFLYITSQETSDIHIDTFSLDKNYLEIKDCIEGPKQYSCTVEANGFSIRNFLLFIEQDIPLELSLSNQNGTIVYNFSGSKTLTEWNLYEEKSAEIMQNINFRDSLELFDKKFIGAYPDSYVSGTIIALHASSWSADTISHYLNLLTPTARTYTYAIHAEKIRVRKKENSVGAPMRIFSAIDFKEQFFSSSMLQGKTILLEFWASWCEPCRKSFPELQKLIKKFQPLGLEVVGISEDMRSEAWLKAIETDSLHNWHHILSGLKEDIDSKGPEKRISHQFGVTVFPTRILVNNQGVIMGRWEGETELNMVELKEMIQRVFEGKQGR